MKLAFPNATLTRLGVSLGIGQAGTVAKADRVFLNETTYDFVTSAPGAPSTVQQGDIQPATSEAGCAAASSWCSLTNVPGTGTVTTVSDPTAEGQSALEFRTPAQADYAKVFTTKYRDAPIASLQTLAYQTWRDIQSTSGPMVLPALKISVATGRSDIPNATLVWEPYQADAKGADITQDSWQQWVPSAAHGWWSTSNRPTSASSSLGPLGFRQNEASWAEVMNALPNATVQTIGIGQGSYNTGTIARSDVLRVNRDSYDFQPGAGTTASPPASPSPAASPSASPTAAASATPTASATATPTTSSTGGSGGGGTAATPAAGQSSPSGTASPTSSSGTSTAGGAELLPLTLLTDRAETTPGTPVAIDIHGTPGRAVQLLAYSRPSTSYGVVRTATTDGAGNASFRVLPGTNTRVYVRYTQLAAGTDSPSVVIGVRTALSLSAYRDGVRQYHFQGRNLPRLAGQLITLYRVDSAGREIRTALTRTNASGIWRIDRTFVGSGEFVFVARTGQTLNNAPGKSNVRLTVIY